MRTIQFYLKTFEHSLLFFLILLLAGCAGIPQKGPGPHPPLDDAASDMERYQKESEETQVSLLKILSAEAEKFVLQGNLKEALLVYNQALSIADETQVPSLINAVEALLEKMPADAIKTFGEIKQIQIPQPLILYWTGVNYGQENRLSASRDALDAFLSQYPDHRYAPDARELLAIISKTTFDRQTIGCLLPLTGKYAMFGERALNGIQLAIDALSSRYSQQLNLVVLDTKADPKVAAEGVQKLYEKNVAAIIGPLLAEQDAGVVAQRLKIPLIALTQKNEFPLMGDYLFANFISPEMQVETLGNYLFNQLGLETVAILYPDERYGRRYMELFWDVADKHKVRVTGVESYDGTKTDFSEPIQKLTGEFYPVPDVLLPKAPEEPDVKAVDADKDEPEIKIDFQALFIPDSPSRLNLILPQLAFNDATGMYLAGTNLWHHKSLLEGAKGYYSRAVITDGFFSSSRNPVTLQFTRTFESLYGENPQFLEAIAYDTTMILFQTALSFGIDSREALKNELSSRRLFEGVTGLTTFDPEGVAQRELFLITIKNGQFVEISR